MFEVIPAIDLLNGKCVRLTQGKFDAETIYSLKPVETAKKWEELGAKRLHVVDLNGARTGIPENIKLIKEIIHAVNIPIQIGGGIRNVTLIDEMLKEGADRVILGTTAILNPNLLSNLCPKFGEKLAIAIDVKGDKVTTHGWAKTSPYNHITLAQQAVSLGARRFIYTDIKRDGMLVGPDLEGVKNLAVTLNVPIIASGGISSKQDIENLRQLASFGVEGCVVGKALYTGAVKLEEVL